MAAPPIVVKHARRDLSFFLAGDKCHLAELLNANNPEDKDLALPYSLALAYVEPGERTLKHVLSVSEVYFVIEGKGLMWIDDQAYPVETSSCYHIPGGCTQWLENTGEGCFRFLCIVSPPWEPAVEEVLEPTRADAQ